jgi:hypothetical protein
LLAIVAVTLGLINVWLQFLSQCNCKSSILAWERQYWDDRNWQIIGSHGL